MTHTIVLASAKGGTGKTTCALNLAVALAERGHAILLVDLDPQGSIGLALAKKDTEWRGLAEYLMEEVTLDDAILNTKLKGLDILPRGKLSAVDICEYERALYDTDALSEIAVKIGGRYEFILLDTPSGMGMVTRAALRASRFLLAPLQAEPMALRSIAQVLQVVDYVQQTENPNLKLLGILPTMVNLENDASLGVMNTVWTGFGGVLDTYIPRADVFLAASEIGLPIDFLPGKKRPEARRFEMLSMEMEMTIAQLGEKDEVSHERVQRELV